jgi:hypothetical protein
MRLTSFRVSVTLFKFIYQETVMNNQNQQNQQNENRQDNINNRNQKGGSRSGW